VRLGPRVALVPALGPLCGFLLGVATASDAWPHAGGALRGGIAALALAAAAFAFVALRPRACALAALAASLSVGVAFLVAGAGADGALAAAQLIGAQALAAAGFAALGRRVGAGSVGAGAVTSILLALALTGLFWADPVAEHVPERARWGLRQAVLHLDSATALAYDAAHLDRLLAPGVYDRVPLANTSIERPRAATTALCWALFGLCAGLLAALGASLRRG